jgi:hypothetical protein
MRLKIYLFICGLFLGVCAIAQTHKQKRAAQLYVKAFHYRATRRPARAFKKMARSISKNPGSPDAYSQLGQWYFEQHQFLQSAAVFQSGAGHCANGERRFARPWARSLLYAGLPDNALQLINKYGTSKNNTGWDDLRAQAYFIKQALAYPAGEWPVNMGLRVNSDDPELFPSMAVDTQALYFTRRINNMDEDLYEAGYDSCGGWLSALNMGVPPNSPELESSLFISADGHYLFFTRCGNRSPDGYSEGGCDIYMAYRMALDSDWTIAEPFGSTINTPDYEGMPSLSPDNRELYFVSNRPGGYGGFDIWVSRFEDGLWQLPINAGPSINTAGNETAPYIALDNETLYFTSDGWPGMGGSDIFMSHKTGDTSWAPAENLGYPINTAYDERSECINIDGKKMYFASDRNGPPGNYDLYETILPASLRPITSSYLKGYVYDSLTKARLNYASVFIRNAATGQNIYQLHSNRGDGSYLVTLHVGNNYIVHTESIGYTEVDDTLTLDTAYLHRPMVHNVAMLPSGYLKPISDTVVATLHYEVNIVELSRADKDAISAALAPWLQEKAITVMVNAYTDNTGTPMINEELSYKRAAIVAKEVVAMGVDEAMVQSKGWGEARMIAPNDNEDGQRKNRRVEIIIKR